jgi:lipoyl(octanoyl) transferase
MGPSATERAKEKELASRAADRRPIPYREAREEQKKLVGRRQAGEIPDILWLLEHEPVITFGSSSSLKPPQTGANLLLSEEAIAARGIALSRSERGGDITFHEPGQLVGYPIVDIGGPGERDLHLYLRQVEEGILSFLGSLGLAATRVPGRTGVWMARPPRKIAAIGVRASRWVTSHGFALNVENGLEGFGLIVPCGIRDAGVTSLARELEGKPLPAWQELCSGIHHAMEQALGRPLKLVLGGEVRDLSPAGGSPRS